MLGFQELVHRVGQFVDAFRPVFDQLEMLTRSVKFTMAARKAKAAEEALHVYALAKRYARNPNSSVLPHIEILRRALGRKVPRPRAAAPVPDGEKEVATA